MMAMWGEEGRGKLGRSIKVRREGKKAGAN
jgi:hypothetical protein